MNLQKAFIKYISNYSIFKNKLIFLLNSKIIITSQQNYSSKINFIMDLDNQKKIAAHRAIDDHIKSTKTNYIIGIGSGSTIVYAVEHLAKIAEENSLKIICIPTSYQAKELILQHKILYYSDLNIHHKLDFVFDGADEVDKNMTLIKGGGGCLTQEKIVASCTNNLIIMADYTKESQSLGDQYKKGIPIEVIPMSYNSIIEKITKKYGGEIILRTSNGKAGPLVTDNGNFILDWKFSPGEYDWNNINNFIKMLPGVVETGLFINMAKQIYFGMPDGSVKIRLP